ncbi:GTPase LSG1-2 [Hibiscus syriacus]|uniref:GTPase LSG1-2 n=1 Tax=Hibiscus syriacus TaxID=106335 RepID=A0A6A2YVW8_HIBSY|nr:GTPase LSG1-2 [Hibiscus syriacus]
MGRSEKSGVGRALVKHHNSMIQQTKEKGRPPWNAAMSVEELDANEKQAFLVWRRSLARLEENEKLVLTPFEKNLDIWRQLWRVLERSDLLVLVVDARDPLFYRCPDFEINLDVKDVGGNLSVTCGVLLLAARLTTLEILNDKSLRSVINVKTVVELHVQKDELLVSLQSEAEEIVKMRKSDTGNTRLSDIQSPRDDVGGNSAPKSMMVGFVGYPNVGKSSTINALVGQKRTGITSAPGKMKHFQTLIISDELTLCPGLHREAVQVVANRVRRHIIEDVYKIKLPKPKPYESQSRPPQASEVLRAYCASRGYVASSGLLDETRAARQILKDYIDGKLPHYEIPPGMSDDDGVEDDGKPSSTEARDSDASDVEESLENGTETTPVSEHALDDLSSFDLANGLASKKETVKKPNASHKHHKKPQRKKDRSWRVGNDDGDGMPVVRVFQKPVNSGPLNG